MGNQTARNEVFGDYAAFLHALLPQAQGFMFHDRYARLFWHDNAPDTSQLNADFHATLKTVLEKGELQGDSARVHLPECTAYLVRLESDKGRTLGVLTALVDRDVGNMPHKFCTDLLSPARRSMERELSLRVNLLDANRKLTVHNSESDFLRTIGALARGRLAHQAALQEILQGTVTQLALDGAVFFSPEYDCL